MNVVGVLLAGWLGLNGLILVGAAILAWLRRGQPLPPPR